LKFYPDFDSHQSGFADRNSLGWSAIHAVSLGGILNQSLNEAFKMLTQLKTKAI
jgi:hypothetical protein